jgi:hypothetical protein
MWLSSDGMHTEPPLLVYFCCQSVPCYCKVSVKYDTILLITVAARSKVWTVFARSNAGIVGSNPTQRHGYCLCVYSVCMLSRVRVAALRRADHSSKQSYRLCKKDYGNWRRGQGPTKGCRATDEWMIQCLEIGRWIPGHCKQYDILLDPSRVCLADVYAWMRGGHTEV